MKTFKEYLINEDSIVGSAGPANVVSTGAIAGTGEKGGEPGVKPRRKRTAIMKPLRKRSMPKM